MSSARTIVRQRYRSLNRLVKRLPERTGLSSSPSSSLSSAYRCREESWRQLRTSFREPLGVNESVEDRIKKADERLSFLKMITPKLDHSSSNAGVLLDNTNEGGGRWIYKNGKRIEGGSGTVRDQRKDCRCVVTTRNRIVRLIRLISSHPNAALRFRCRVEA